MHVVSGSADMRAIIWETRAYQAQTVFTGHTTPIEWVCWAADGQTVASSSQGGSVRVTSVATDELSWWDTGGGPPPVHVSQILTFDPTQPTSHGSPEPGWREWGSSLSVSQAGCFAMDATWPGGHWRIFFGVGH
jgi:WD40 repeat protein